MLIVLEVSVLSIRYMREECERVICLKSDVQYCNAIIFFNTRERSTKSWTAGSFFWNSDSAVIDNCYRTRADYDVRVMSLYKPFFSSALAGEKLPPRGMPVSVVQTVGEAWAVFHEEVRDWHSTPSAFDLCVKPEGDPPNGCGQQRVWVIGGGTGER